MDPDSACMPVLRRLRRGDAGALARFYNGLSEEARRTFRPLGVSTTVDACRGIVNDNPADGGPKRDYVALRGDRIVGWGFVWDVAGEGPVFGLAVADDHRGRGLGGRLMDRAMEAARELGLRRVTLTVVAENEIAWRMYERRGFRKCGEFTGQDGLAYFRMECDPARRRPGG